MSNSRRLMLAAAALAASMDGLVSLGSSGFMASGPIEDAPPQRREPERYQRPREIDAAVMSAAETKRARKNAKRLKDATK